MLPQDLFPGVDCPRVGYPEFNEAVKTVLQNTGYILIGDQVNWIIYLFFNWNIKFNVFFICKIIAIKIKNMWQFYDEKMIDFYVTLEIQKIDEFLGEPTGKPH